MAFIKPIALRNAKIVNNFGLSECNRVKRHMAKNMLKVIYLCSITLNSAPNGAV